tara:strand:- start:2261 stop:3640 length:1380 start_codon:yes stop_codon:yes gene_type:complete
MVNIRVKQDHKKKFTFSEKLFNLVYESLLNNETVMDLEGQTLRISSLSALEKISVSEYVIDEIYLDSTKLFNLSNETTTLVTTLNNNFNRKISNNKLLDISCGIVLHRYNLFPSSQHYPPNKPDIIECNARDALDIDYTNNKLVNPEHQSRVCPPYWRSMPSWVKGFEPEYKEVPIGEKIGYWRDICPSDQTSSTCPGWNPQNGLVISFSYVHKMLYDFPGTDNYDFNNITYDGGSNTQCIILDNTNTSFNYNKLKKEHYMCLFGGNGYTSSRGVSEDEPLGCKALKHDLDSDGNKLDTYPIVYDNPDSEKEFYNWINKYINDWTKSNGKPPERMYNEILIKSWNKLDSGPKNKGYDKTKSIEENLKLLQNSFGWSDVNSKPPILGFGLIFNTSLYETDKIKGLEQLELDYLNFRKYLPDIWKDKLVGILGSNINLNDTNITREKPFFSIPEFLNNNKF